jgi:hypothetical protein
MFFAWIEVSQFEWRYGPEVVNNPKSEVTKIFQNVVEDGEPQPWGPRLGLKVRKFFHFMGAFRSFVSRTEP